MSATAISEGLRFTAAVHRLALEVQEDPRAKPKTCPACGANFGCLPGECWCASLRLSPATRQRLQNEYAGCLCPACLIPLSE